MPNGVEDKSAGCVPFLKWAGGKRWFAAQHLAHAPKTYRTYIEPFLGSAAVFFSLCPPFAILSDLNLDLIEAYRAIKADWEQVYATLKKHQRAHSAAHYYSVRKSRPVTEAGRAARFIYLNRTCWNALYRVNLRGQFNVPKGTKSAVLLDTDDFEAIRVALQDTELLVSDFAPVIERATKEDLIFADPPYITGHTNNGFVKYNEKLFSWKDQIRLRDALVKADRRGAFVLATNADHESIRALYKDHLSIERVRRSSVIAGLAHARGTTTELIITSKR